MLPTTNSHVYSYEICFKSTVPQESKQNLIGSLYYPNTKVQCTSIYYKNNKKRLSYFYSLGATEFLLQEPKSILKTLFL